MIRLIIGLWIAVLLVRGRAIPLLITSTDGVGPVERKGCV